MNFQLCRHAVNDPHKADLVTTQVCSPARITPVFRSTNTFGELAVTCTPLRMVNLNSLYFTVFTPNLTGYCG